MKSTAEYVLYQDVGIKILLIITLHFVTVMLHDVSGHDGIYGPVVTQ